MPGKLLGMHVIGRGFGECIILEFPDFPPALIDCGSGPVADFATRFISTNLKSKKLAFVGVTHPHKDHMRGVSDVINFFGKNCSRLLLFQGFACGAVVLEYLQYVKNTPAAASLDENFFCPDVVREWAAIRECLNKFKLKTENCIEWPRPKSFGGVQVRCIAPISSFAAAFEGALSRCSPSYPNRCSPPPANHASYVLEIRWKQTRILLCSDCENASWQALAAEAGSLSGKIHGLKVAHHGSENGFHELVSTRLGSHSVAVITPYNRGHVPLPDHETLTKYSNICNRVFITKHRTNKVSDDGNNLLLICEARSNPNGPADTILQLRPQELAHPNMVSIYFNDKGEVESFKLGEEAK